MLAEIHKAICENLESYCIAKQYIIEGREEFGRHDVGSTLVDLYQGCGDETAEDLEMKATIQTSNA